MVNAFYPMTLKEALQLRTDSKDSMIVSGGSDVMVVKKDAQDVIFVNHIKELQAVELREGKLRIGAGATYVQLIADQMIPEILKKAMRKIASPAIRNVGTIAGNVCNASPAGDTLSVLYAMDAQIVKSSLDENGDMIEKVIPIENFILGIRKIALESNEMVTAIQIPASSYEGMTKYYHEKVGAREAEAISKLSFTGFMKIQEGIITDIRIAFGSVGITTVRRRDIEEKILGYTREELNSRKKKIVSEYADILHPIDDQRSTAEYRKKVCLNLLEDFLTEETV